MGFRGNLASMSLADIFQNLAANGQTGTLAVERGGGHRYVYFEGGLVTDAAREHSGQGLRPLAGYLVGRCLVSEDQAEYALRRSEDTGGNLFKTVPELGYASEDEVGKLVSRYVEEEIYDLFTWESGDFEFTDGERPEGVFGPEGASVGVRLPTGGLVMEAARRIDEWGRIRSALPSGKEVFIASESSEDRVESLDAVSKRVFGLADGTRDIDDLVADSYLSRFEVGGVLCSFLEDGLLRSAEPGDLEEAAAELVTRRRPDRAVKVYERLLALGHDDLDMRNRLAETAIQAEDPGRAVIHLGVVADRMLEAGRGDKAAEVWERMLEAMPGNTRAHQGLAEHYRRKNRKKQCLQHYTELCRSHMKSGGSDRAVAAARAGLDVDGRSFELRAMLAEALLEVGKRAEAADEYERLGDQYLSDHRSRAAADAYRKALQVEHNRKHAKTQLAAIMADEAARKRARGRILATLVMFLIVGALVGLVGAYEYLLAKPRYERAMTIAKAKMAEGQKLYEEAEKDETKFDQAVAAYKEARDACLSVETLISLHRYEKKAEGLRGRCEGQISKIESEQLDKQRRALKQIDDTKKEARTLIAQGELDGAKAKLENLLKIKMITDKDRRWAQKQLKDIERSLDEIRDVVSRKGSVVDETKWFVEVMNLVQKYPNHPEVKKLTVRVKIESDPAGALVSMANSPPTPTPCNLRFPVTKAVHLTFKWRGYKNKTVSVEARDVPRGSQTISQKLERVPAWKVRLGPRIEAPLLLVGELLVLGDRGGTVYALEAKNGKRRWKRQLGKLSMVTGAVAVSGGTVYVPSLDKRIYALDLATGRDRWNPLVVGDLIRSAPRVIRIPLLNDQRFAFFGAGDGHVYCVDADKGKLRWKSKKYGPIEGSVLATSTTIYVGSDDAYFRALNPTNGKEIWSRKLQGAIRTSPILSPDGKRVYLGTDGGFLYAIDIQKRRVAWILRAKKDIRSGPVLVGDRLFFCTSDGTVRVVRSRQETAEPVWEHKVSGRITAAPLVTQTRVYVGSHEGSFYALDRGDDGTPVWSYKTGDRVRSTAVWVKGFVIFGSDDGYLYAFDERP
jgi:outer membrane protein assembly factor BamB/tetratricopeptide (TPR) repeat protein